MNKIKPWSTIFSKNLSTNSDESFKVVQIIEPEVGFIIFDLRQTFRGRLLKDGISFLVPEFNWLKKVLLSSENNDCRLEHNDRIISINKKEENLISMKIQKSDGTIRQLILNKFEWENLKRYFNEIEMKLLRRATECGINTEFGEMDFFRETFN